MRALRTPVIRGHRTPMVVVAVVIALGALTPLAAGGSTIDGKKAEAAHLQAQIDANGDRIAALGEQYNGAVLAYKSAQDAVAVEQRRLAAAEKQESKMRELVTLRAAELYMGAEDPVSILPSSNIKTFNEIGVRKKYGAVATDNNERLIADLQRAQQDLKIQRKRLDKQVAATKAKRDLIDSAKRRVESANAQERKLLSQVKGELAILLTQEAARQQAAIRDSLARLARQQAGAGASVPASAVGGDTIPNLPAPSARAAVAIAFAEAQLGKPYVFAAAGPDSYDCSGLTMMAWRAAGVSMPHYSGAQYAMFPHVPLNALQPGDLIFKGPGGSEHVSMYLGAGLQIAATHTGDYVRIQPVSSNPVGAARPT